MRNVLQIAVGLFVITMMFGAGCVPGEATPLAETTRAPTLAPTLPPSLMPTPVPTPVLTPTPSPEPAPTPTAIPRPTVTPTPTFTPVPTPIATPTSTSPSQPTVAWPLPTDKYIFIERWVTIESEVDDRGSIYAFIDYPTYQYMPQTRVLVNNSSDPRLLSAGNIADLRVVYGRGTSRVGSAGQGANSSLKAVAKVPFTDAYTGDTDAQLTLLRVDGDGVAYLGRGSEDLVLRPGDEGTVQVKAVVRSIRDHNASSTITGKERISNFGILDKASIRFTKPQVTLTPSSGRPGITVTVNISGFTPGSTVPANSITVDQFPFKYDCLNDVFVVPVDGSGTFAIKLPLAMPQGENYVRIRDSTDRQGTGLYVVES